MRPVSDVDRVADLLQWIESRLDESLTPQWAARTTAWSLWHFHRKFQEISGESYLAYLRGRLLNRAAEDLVGTRLSIDRIASNAGFAHVAGFYKAFSRRFRAAPLAYRRDGVMLWHLGREALDPAVLYHMQAERVDAEPLITWQSPRHCAGLTGRNDWYGFDWLFQRFRLDLERAGIQPPSIQLCFQATQEDVVARRLTISIGIESRLLGILPYGWADFSIPGGHCAEFHHHGGSYELSCFHIWRHWRGRDFLIPYCSYSMQLDYDGTNPFTGRRPLIFRVPILPTVGAARTATRS